MRLVTYHHEGQARSGAQIDGQIIDLNRAYKLMLRHGGNHDELAVADARVPADMIALLQGREASLRAAQNALSFVRVKLMASDGRYTSDGIVYASEQIAFLSPVLRPGKVICLGLNYRDHAAEAGMGV